VFCAKLQAIKQKQTPGFLKVQWPIKLVLKNGRHVTYEP
jgi:hypothetical protein